MQVVKQAQIRYNSEIKWKWTLWFPLMAYKKRGVGGGAGGGGGGGGGGGEGGLAFHILHLLLSPAF